MKKILFLILNLTYAGCSEFMSIPPCPNPFSPRSSDFGFGICTNTPSFNYLVGENDMKAVKKIVAKECKPSPFREHAFEEEECLHIHSKDYFGRTTLFYVESLEMTKFLISKGAKIRTQDKYGLTPLHFAHNPEIAKFFLDNGLGLEDRDKNGRTPLFQAVLDDRIKTARFLFQQGASPYTSKIDDKQTSLEIAEDKIRKDLSKWNQLIKEFEDYQINPKKEESK